MIKSNTYLINEQLLNTLFTINLTCIETYAYHTLVLTGVMTAVDLPSTHEKDNIVIREKVWANWIIDPV